MNRFATTLSIAATSAAGRSVTIKAIAIKTPPQAPDDTKMPTE
jgi:hypothetical protein